MRKNRQIPFYKHDIGSSEKREVLNVLKSGWIHTGEKTREFESAFKTYTGSSHALALNSATAGLFLVLKAYGIGPGDEVITSPNTFSATAAAIAQTGADIVFADIGKDWNLSPEETSRKMTNRTKAIIPVDLGGYPCDYKKFYKNLNNHPFKPSNVFQEKLNRPLLVADCAHSLGAIYHGAPAGSTADLSVFSFHVVKNITTGDGGMITSGKTGKEHLPDKSFYDDFFKILKPLSFHGMTRDGYEKTVKGRWQYDITIPGYKYNMIDIDAAIGLAQMKRLPGFLKKRRELYHYYYKKTQPLPVSIRPMPDTSKITSYHLFQISIDGADETKRNRIIEKMKENGIVLNVHFIPLPLMTYYKKNGHNIDDFPETKSVWQNALSLPFFTKLKKKEIVYIIKTLRKYL